MTATADIEKRPSHPSTLPSPAAVRVAAVGAVSAIVLTLSATRYGYFGDELYFLAAGRRLSWGYADQGPMLPLLARIMDTLVPGSLVALRLPAIAATVLAVVLCAAIAREFGGGRTAQTLTALAYATSSFLLMQGKNLSTNAIDTALWVVITWLVVRWVRTRRDRLLLFAALVTAVDMQVKWLIPFFWIAVVVSASVFGPRQLVRRPLLWFGGLVVLVTTVPSLLWQARHGWPQIALGAVISEESGVLGGRLLFIPLAVICAGTAGAVLLCYGMWALLRTPSLREYRFLGVATLLIAGAFLVLGGRIYYVAGMYAVVFGAGAVALTQRWERVRSITRKRLMSGTGWVLVAVSALLVVWSTPWQDPARISPPASDLEAALNIGLYGEFGWPELAAGVIAAYESLSPPERADTAVITETYWQAGALDQLARDRLPSIHSPSRGFGYFEAPPEVANYICVGGDQDRMQTQFAVLEPIGRVDTRLGFLTITRDVTIWKCAKPRAQWSRVWSEWMHL